MTHSRNRRGWLWLPVMFAAISLAMVAIDLLGAAIALTRTDHPTFMTPNPSIRMEPLYPGLQADRQTVSDDIRPCRPLREVDSMALPRKLSETGLAGGRQSPCGGRANEGLQVPPIPTPGVTDPYRRAPCPRRANSGEAQARAPLPLANAGRTEGYGCK